MMRQFAEALHDTRASSLIDHTFLEMVRSRIYGVLAAYEDQNDHETLRHDPVFKLIADRSPDADPLASQPTLSRFENAIGIPSLKRLRDVFIDQFIGSLPCPSTCHAEPVTPSVLPRLLAAVHFLLCIPASLSSQYRPSV